MLKKVYAQIAALRRLKRFVMSVRLYKAYVLPHFEYCHPILLGMGKSLSKKMDSANHYTHLGHCWT